MRILTYISSFIFLLLVLTSCSGKQYQTLFEQKTANTDTTSRKTTGDLSAYRIKPQDLLQIRNLQNISYVVDAPQTGNGTSVGGGGAIQTYQVDEDGSVALPVIGHVAVAGLTRSQAAKLVEDLYRKNLLKDPIIELKITNLKVTMLGEITGQGNFPLIKDKTTLVEMIGQAGGLTKNANETNIKIIRGDQSNPQITVINLRDVSSINDPRAILQSGDIIYIAQNKRSIRNENLQNITSIAQPVLLLINTALLIISFSHR
ncbi:polysaccharide biosynthesis/export family protein [Mucilaginibacter dorajii]|uniref:Soluble ligand binding domain-containing protein n=1 Tax=Mucilaginibacter dorajii TaxID=692994 RepID=A0ABP7Q2W5_9SPHI|nr:polysaccharide biosynthesis/export family protein [Mucilaginibacter dorajii]MCS3732749.1 polysaccharide export outer membrane protein [Mucilaginibacter dorajii]